MQNDIDFEQGSSGKSSGQRSDTNAGNPSNKIKDPADWTTGDEKMTDAQRSYLQTITGHTVDENLTKAEAAKKIDEYKNSQNPAGEGGSNTQNAIKDPDDWATGKEMMTEAQKSYLKTLSDEAGEPTDENLTKAEASKRIEELQHKTGRGTSH